MPTIHNSSRPPGSSSSTQVPFPRRKRFTILFISSSLFLFHLILSSKLSGLTTSLRGLVSIDGDEEEEEEDEYAEGGGLRAVRGIVTLLGIARVSSFSPSLITPLCVTDESVREGSHSSGVYVQLVSHSLEFIQFIK